MTKTQHPSSSILVNYLIIIVILLLAFVGISCVSAAEQAAVPTAKPAKPQAAQQNIAAFLRTIPLHIIITAVVAIPILAFATCVSIGLGRKVRITKVGHNLLRAPVFRGTMYRMPTKYLNRIRNNRLLNYLFEWPLTFLFEVTLGEAIVLLVLTLLCCVWFVYGMLVKGDVATEPLRAIAAGCSSVAILLFAIVILPVTRHSIWLFLLGLNFDRSVRVHRFLAECCVYTMLLHAIFELIHFGAVKKKLNTVLLLKPDADTGTINVMGIVAGVLFLLMAACAWKPFRQRFFSLFYISHYIFGVPAIVTMIIHNVVYIAPYMAASLIFFAFDLLLRVVFTFCFKSAKVLSLRQDNQSRIVTLVLQPKKKLLGKLNRARPGAHVYVWIRQVSWLPQAHPFSISDFDAQTGRITLHIKESGYWKSSFTRRLRQLAKKVENGTIEAEKIHVSCEGPYGKLKLQPSHYCTLVLIAGGIGITPMMSILTHYTRKIRSGKSKRLQNMVLHWCVANEGVLHVFDRQLEQLAEVRESKGSVLPSVQSPEVVSPKDREEFAPELQFWVTGPQPEAEEAAGTESAAVPTTVELPEVEPTASPVGADAQETITVGMKLMRQSSADTTSASEAIEVAVPAAGSSRLSRPWINTDNLHYGRPDFKALFAQLSTKHSGEGYVAVYVCGPPALIRGVEAAAWKANKQSGGDPIFQVHREMFDV